MSIADSILQKLSFDRSNLALEYPISLIGLLIVRIVYLIPLYTTS